MPDEVGVLCRMKFVIIIIILFFLFFTGDVEDGILVWHAIPLIFLPIFL